MNAVLQPTPHPFWQGGELHCTQRIDETADSATFVLSADHPARFDFLPGQFVTVGVTIDGQTHYRAYSISSSPDNTDSLAITVKRVSGGLVSNHLIDHFQIGDSLEAMAPAGEFHLPDTINGTQVMLSAGSGITPMMSMARWLLAHKPEIAIHFIHSARSEDDVIFRDELIAMAERHPAFRLDIFLSKPKSKVWCHTGRLTPEQLTALLPEASDSTLYLCGNDDYMAMIETWHQASGLPAHRFHKESFCPVAQPETASTGETYTLSVPAFEKIAQIADGQSLLGALEAESLPIIGACRSGVCGSCKCKVVKGEVERLSTETLTPEEIDSGVVLACSTRAHSDLIVKLVI